MTELDEARAKLDAAVEQAIPDPEKRAEFQAALREYFDALVVEAVGRESEGEGARDTG